MVTIISILKYGCHIGLDYYGQTPPSVSKLHYELDIVFPDLLSEMRLVAAIVLLPLKAYYAALCLFSLQYNPI